jgi:hypothetical protein
VARCAASDDECCRPPLGAVVAVNNCRQPSGSHDRAPGRVPRLRRWLEFRRMVTLTVVPGRIESGVTSTVVEVVGTAGLRLAAESGFRHRDG